MLVHNLALECLVYVIRVHDLHELHEISVKLLLWGQECLRKAGQPAYDRVYLPQMINLGILESPDQLILLIYR